MEIKEQLLVAKSLDELERLRVKIFGKSGIIAEQTKELKHLDASEKAERGKIINQTKRELEEIYNKQLSVLNKKAMAQKLKSESIDRTIPGREIPSGTLHPITSMINEIRSAFSRLGFNIVEGPEIESVFRNFDALNVPPSHPSRNLSDTFYFHDNRLLRTHTTTVQIRCLEREKPPIVAISAGKVYRPDYDATHTPMFHQMDGIFLVKGATFANLKAILNEFIVSLFPDAKTRFRPHFFPFTEPSAELDMSCPSCSGMGCNVCKKSGWIAILGCGMISPEVLKHFGYTLSDIRGFAFGMGIERLVMIKYGIKDIRLLYENDLRLLKQFY